MNRLIRSAALCLFILGLPILAVSCKGGDGASADAAKDAGTNPAPASPASAPPADAGSPATASPASGNAPEGQSASPLPQGHPPVGNKPTPAPAVPITPSGPPAQIIATVNGRNITRGELDFTIKNVAQPNVPVEKQAEVRRNILNSLIDQELIYQKAVASKIEVSPAEINATMAKMKSDFPDEKLFAAELAKDGMTPANVEMMIRHTMVIDKYVNNIVGQVKVTPEDESKFYEQNKEKMKHPEQVRASHILIRVPADAPAEQKAAQKAKAADVLSKARGGSDFSALAKEFSQDSGSAQRGGDLGYFGKGAMMPAFDQAVFSLKTGTISDLVETSFGFHIIKVTDHRPEGYAPLADVRGKIHDFLSNQRVQGEVQKLTLALRKTAKIEVSL